jgi:hypothetical protein
MRQVLIGAVVAAAVSIGVWLIVGTGGDSQPSDTAVPAPALSYTEDLIEDGWVARAPGADHKPLAPAANSVCYLTKIEIKGIQGPEDGSSCTIGIDDFTGFWQVTAAVGEGGRSEVRCNARCLVWE